MKKLSGLVLDVYDDADGAISRELFGTPDQIPEITKEAHVLTVDERSALPDEAFALILMDGNVELRKFATVDPGNTAMSVAYFLKTAHKLPAEAQSVAAENLWAACDCHGMEAPEVLKKVALALREGQSKEAMGLLGLVNGALIVPGQVSEARKNLAATQGAQGAVMTPPEVKQRRSMMGAV
jgi:hypothetical protein